MGGHQVPSHGSGDDGYNEEGYDESQRAEILEATRSGTSDGVVLTDIEPDLDEEDAADEDVIEMESGTVGEVDPTADRATEDRDEDEAQDAFDDGVEDDADLDDAEDVALKP